MDGPVLMSIARFLGSFLAGSVRSGSVIALALAASTAGLSGQTLDRVEELLRQDRVQEAREALLAWETEGERPGWEERQRALWYRGILTLDPIQAEATFRRLALEYPGGSYSDRALHRLGQAAALRGDLEEAEGHFSVLVRDYLNSPLRLEAQDWLRRNRAAVGSNRPGDAEERASVSGEDTGQTGDFTAQLGAFSTEENARILATRLEEAGFRPRIVLLPEDDYFRVRVGRFETAESARAFISRLRERGFEAGLGIGTSGERPVGG